MRANSKHYKDEGMGMVSEIPEFLTYPRQFITYKWYRPVITAVVTGVVLLLFNTVLMMVTGVMTGGGFQSVRDMVAGGYDTMDTYTAAGALLSLGNLVLSTTIGLVFLAAVIICRKRGMFDNYRTNDAAEYNAKMEAKLASKA